MVETAVVPEGPGMTPEKYAKMVKAFMEMAEPTASEIAKAAGVSRKTVYKALKEGWPKLGLPPLGDAATSLAKPENVHEMMAGLEKQKQEIYENLFGQTPATTETKAMTKAAKKEATSRAAEHGMAARVALSSAVKTSKAAEKLADHILEKIEDGEIEFPEQIRLEHLIVLAKITDTANAGVMKALQVEKLKNGEPTDVANQQVLIMLQSASPEQLQHIVKTGHIPPDMMTVDNSGKKLIDAKATTK